MKRIHLQLCLSLLASLAAAHVARAADKPGLTLSYEPNWLMIHGKIYILPADVPALLKRYAADFPERAK